jgi:VanZ family protein
VSRRIVAVGDSLRLPAIAKSTPYLLQTEQCFALNVVSLPAHLRSHLSMRPIIALIFLDPRYENRRYLSAILLYLAIILMGSIPGARADIGNFASGLVLHSLAYAAVTILLFTGSSGSASLRAVKAILTVVAMGALDEFIQSFLPYRRASVIDWAVDCNAAVIASALLWATWPRLMASPPPP